MTRRRPAVESGFADAEAAQLEQAQAMQAGSNAVAIRRRQKPTFEVVSV